MATDLTALAVAVKGEVARGAAEIGAMRLAGEEGAGEPVFSIERAEVSIPVQMHASGVGTKGARIAVTLPARAGSGATALLTIVLVPSDS